VKFLFRGIHFARLRIDYNLCGDLRMFLFREPSEKQLRVFFEAQKEKAFSYNEIGASKQGAPDGYNVDHNRIKLGEGAQKFALAIQAIQNWQMFNLGWVRVWQTDAPIEIGTCALVIVRHFGFYSLNICRIVYLINEDAPIKKYGFAYGTLEEHAERGEERFSVEWNPEDNSVYYDLFAFSQPRHALARLGYPVSRMMQKRFARNSKQAMFAAVNQ
jgi:uncharacterized protein (UPF0548 family)